jgi:hypothetical protein
VRKAFRTAGVTEEMMSEIFDDPGSAEQFRSGSRIVKGLHIKGQVRGEENLVVEDKLTAQSASNEEF